MKQITNPKWQQCLPEMPEGQLWKAYIKRFTKDPHARLALALQFMPEHKAFKEAVLAVRQMLKGKKNEEQNVLLTLLFELGALGSFLFDTWEIEGVGVAEEVFMDVPREKWLNLEMPYAQLGYTHFDLLTRADGKLFRQVWGQPENQQSAQRYHLDAWETMVDDYCTRMGID